MNRRPTRFAPTLTCFAAAAACLLFSSCPGGKGMIHRSAIAPSVKAIVERHDVYLSADPDMDPVARQVFLNESAILLELVTGDPDGPVPVVSLPSDRGPEPVR